MSPLKWPFNFLNSSFLLYILNLIFCVILFNEFFVFAFQIFNLRLFLFCCWFDILLDKRCNSLIPAIWAFLSEIIQMVCLAEDSFSNVVHFLSILMFIANDTKTVSIVQGISYVFQHPNIVTVFVIFRIIRKTIPTIPVMHPRISKYSQKDWVATAFQGFLFCKF